MEKILLTFGKYQGQDVNDILLSDPQYLRFLYYNAGCGRQLKDWIRSHWNEIEENILTNLKPKS
jgi:hypothetical protein